MRTFKELNKTLPQAKDFIDRNQCLVCGPGVKLEISFDKGEYGIKCGDPEHGPEQWGRPSFKPNMYQEANNRKRRFNTLEKEIGRERTTALANIVKGAVVDENYMRKVEESLWKGAPEIDRTKAKLYCIRYNLDPLANELFLIPYKNGARAAALGCKCSKYPCPHPDAYDWVRVRGINGDRSIVKQTADFSYIDNTPRVMTAAEQNSTFGEVDTSKIWVIVRLQNVVTRAISVGYGNWPKDREAYGSDKGNTKFNMASNHAERQALARLSPGKLPADEAGVLVVDDQYLPKIDTATGEIVDSTAAALPPPFAGAGDPPALATPSPAATSALSDDLGTCPDHGVPNIRLRSKSNPKWHGIGHYIDKEQGGGICYKDKQGKSTTEQPTEGDFTEQPTTEPPPSTGNPAGATDGSGGAAEPMPAASTQEIDGASDEGPCRKDIEDLSKQLWGPDWQSGLRKFLASNYQYKSRKDIKEAVVPDIVKKLTAMIEAK